MRGGMIAFVLALAALAAGCVVPSNSQVSAATSGGSGSHVLRVHVTDEPHGAPIPGALVVVSTRSWTWLGGETTDEVTLATDEAGVAEAHVAPDAQARVVAAREGFTQETVRDVSTGPADGSSDLDVPLYHAHMTIWINGSLAPMGGSLQREHLGGFDWDPHAAQFGATDEARRGYAARVILLNLTLDWENTPTAAGDLGIGAGQRSDAPDVVQDANQVQLPPGRYEEKLALSPSDMHRLHWERATALYAGAGTGTAYVAPAGLPYALKVDAVFDGNQALRDSPGFNQVWGVLVAFVVAAFVVRRP